MRALIVTHNFPRFAGDPVGSFVLRLAVALREQGIDSRVVAPGAPDVPAQATIEGIPVTRFRYAPRRLETLAYTGTMGDQVRQAWLARLTMLGFLVQAYRAAARIIHRERIDVVHAHWWFPGGLVARAIHARTGVPYVVTMHGSDIRLAGATHIGARLFRTVSRHAAGLSTVSAWLARRARELDAGVDPVVGPMPIVGDLFRPGGARDENRLLFVGKLAPQKGLHHLLRALAIMQTRPAVDVVGAGRVDDTHLVHLATDLGVADRIQWHPLLSQAELAQLYRKATLHVIPAIDEGLGLTAVESLLSETPVVAFNSGGLPDIVIPNRTGLLVSPEDVNELASAVDRLLLDPDARRQMGQEGRRFALEHFGSDRAARIYAAILRNAAMANSVAPA